MKKLTIDDVLSLAEYERVRDDFRRKVIEVKRLRRVAIGDHISVAFENRQTILFQIQEMVRAERLTDREKVLEEVETFNDLIPGEGELSATLFIEIEDQGEIRKTFDRLKGIDNGRSLYLQIGDEKIFGIFEGGRSSEEKISSVHYVKFPLSRGQAKAFVDGVEPAALILNHPNYKRAGAITPEIRLELAKDLA